VNIPVELRVPLIITVGDISAHVANIPQAALAHDSASVLAQVLRDFADEVERTGIK